MEARYSSKESAAIQSQDQQITAITRSSLVVGWDFQTGGTLGFRQRACLQNPGRVGPVQARIVTTFAKMLSEARFAVSLELFVRLLRIIAETGKIVNPGELNVACRAISLLAND